MTDAQILKMRAPRLELIGDHERDEPNPEDLRHAPDGLERGRTIRACSFSQLWRLRHTGTIFFQ